MIKQSCSKLTQALAPFDCQADTNQTTPLPNKPANYALCGRKGCGKTTLMLNLISKPESPWYKHFNLIFLISPTASRDDKMSELVEDIGDQYYETLDNEVLQDIMDTIDEYNRRWKHNKKKGKPAHLIIYDDVIHMMKGKQSKLVDLLATQNRHYNITNMYLLQKWNTYMSPLIRANLDLISFFRSDNKKELDSFIQEMNYDEDKLRVLYEYAVSEPYSFLHINLYHTPPKFYKKFDEIKIK